MCRFDAVKPQLKVHNDFFITLKTSSHSKNEQAMLCKKNIGPLGELHR